MSEDHMRMLVDTMNKAMELHEKTHLVLQGNDVLLVALHGQFIRKTLQSVNPGAWEQAEQMCGVYDQILGRNEAGH